MSSSSSSSAAAPYQPPEVSGPHPVLLHVYDVTNASSDAINATVAGLNKLTKDVLGLGGVFHGGAFSFFFFFLNLDLSLSTSREKINSKVKEKKLKKKKTNRNRGPRPGVLLRLRRDGFRCLPLHSEAESDVHLPRDCRARHDGDGPRGGASPGRRHEPAVDGRFLFSAHAELRPLLRGALQGARVHEGGPGVGQCRGRGRGRRGEGGERGGGGGEGVCEGGEGVAAGGCRERRGQRGRSRRWSSRSSREAIIGRV